MPQPDTGDPVPLSFNAIVPMPAPDELRKLEVRRPCSMCGAHGVVPESEEQAAEWGAKWFEWMDPKEREDRSCNVCSGTKKELVGEPGWYKWSIENWGTKWDASFSGPFMALGSDEADVDASIEALGGTLTPTVAVYKFDTAWAPPVPFVANASEIYPELEFELRFAEPGMDFAGSVTYVNGLLIEEEDLVVEDVLLPEEMWY